ncbi:hypothetical protein BCR34DRAFT_602218 [Clohesyomyces aquaticus]|uniref:Transcription factor domain-containing protein n=1 Tax=Clohesyomyces aquaticus TaxID=1231657 RepID=A0A1Y1ZJN8_9PLEO|nr:hypothetical protein BCR34DRAFT_602218 [Clohesyomyces aquaticus]
MPTPTVSPEAGEQQPTMHSEAREGLNIATHGQLPASLYDQQSPALDGLPPFIAPLPAHMLSEDLDFLLRKGAFSMPGPELRVEILQSYVFSIYPFMPMVDIGLLVHAIMNDHHESKVGLLLSQAVMFAVGSSGDIRGIGPVEPSPPRSIWAYTESQMQDAAPPSGAFVDDLGGVSISAIALGTHRPMRIWDESFKVAMLARWKTLIYKLYVIYSMKRHRHPTWKRIPK